MELGITSRRATSGGQTLSFEVRLDRVTMAPGLYRAIAVGVLSLHAAYIAWVIFGAFLTRGRPRRCTLPRWCME